MAGLKFKGRPFNPRTFADHLRERLTTAAVERMRDRVGAIRDPGTGEFPTTVVSMRTPTGANLRVKGSPELVKIVRDRLSLEKMSAPEVSPRVFLSHASEDAELASSIAGKLNALGIETWLDRWEISSGDSIRQQIDAGLGNCTHFVVLLTPRSVGKPWVNLEMDGALERKLRLKAKFIPLRHGLPVESLPPTLSGMLSPEVKNLESDDFAQVVSDILGRSRRPPLGVPASSEVPRNESGRSEAAMRVAKVLVESSENGCFADPRVARDELMKRTELTPDDMADALYELGTLVEEGRGGRSVVARPSLFAEFDAHFCAWDPAKDALRLAADLVNDEEFPTSVPLISAHYGWPPRRLNPAIAYLEERRAIHARKQIATGQWNCLLLRKTDDTRRFVKSRS